MNESCKLTCRDKRYRNKNCRYHILTLSNFTNCYMKFSCKINDGLYLRFFSNFSHSFSCCLSSSYLEWRTCVYIISSSKQSLFLKLQVSYGCAWFYNGRFAFFYRMMDSRQENELSSSSVEQNYLILPVSSVKVEKFSSFLLEYRHSSKKFLFSFEVLFWLFFM